MRTNRWTVRSFGTTPSLPYVAVGRVAACLCTLVPPLHAAAGTLLVTDIDGGPWTVTADSLVAGAGPGLHREVLDLLRPADPH